MRCHRSLLAILVLSVAQAASGATTVRVKGDRVNLRAAAQDSAEVVAQVSTGDELQALSGLEDIWVQVVPPSRVDLWIFAELVQNGQVTVSRAQVRSGAGLNFNVVGSLRRGAPVEERGRLGDWLKIAPPEGTSLWVSRDYVEPVAPSTGAPSPSSMPSTEPGGTFVPGVQDILPLPPPPPPPPPATEPASTLPASAVGLPPPDPRYPEIPPDYPVPAPALPEASAELPTSASPAGLVPEVVLEPAEPQPPRPIPAPSSPAGLPFVAPAPPSVSSAGWETPPPSAAGVRTAPAAPASQAGSRVLFPPSNIETVGPANIPVDRLSPQFAQGTPGRFEGQLAGAGAIFFTPGKHRLVTLNRAGRAVTVCYVIGNERQLQGLMGVRLSISGPVYWYRSTKYPTILAEQIQRLP